MNAFELLLYTSSIVFAVSVIVFFIFVDICERAERRREREEDNEHR